VMGPGQKFLTRVRSAIYGLGFPLKTSNFSIVFASDQKNLLGLQVKKYPGQMRVGLLFTVYQK